MVRILSFFLLIGGFYPAFAQDTLPRFTRLLEGGISIASYRGDLNPSYTKSGAMLHLGLKLNFKKRLNSHFSLGYGTVSGDNPDYVFTGTSLTDPMPNLYVKTRLLTVHYDLQINLWRNRHWMVYISQGLGLVRFSPVDDKNQSLVNQIKTRANGETYSQAAAILPTGIGVYYLFDNGFGFHLHTGWLNTQTRYLDNISQWGNRNKNDNIWQTQIVLVVPLVLKK
jgi:hypothetical protein